MDCEDDPTIRRNVNSPSQREHVYGLQCHLGGLSKPSCCYRPLARGEKMRVVLLAEGLLQHQRPLSLPSCPILILVPIIHPHSVAPSSTQSPSTTPMCAVVARFSCAVLSTKSLTGGTSNDVSCFPPPYFANTQFAALHHPIQALWKLDVIPVCRHRFGE